MTLDKLLRTTAWTETTLAKAVGVGQPTINRLRTKRRTASPQLACNREGDEGRGQSDGRAADPGES